MSGEVLRDDNQGYAAGQATNGRGFVLAIQRTVNLPDTRVRHSASALRGRTGNRPRLLLVFCSLRHGPRVFSTVRPFFPVSHILGDR